MNIKLTILGLGAALVISGCSSTTPGTNANSNRAAGTDNNTAGFVNSNQAPITGNTGTTGATNANTTTSGNSNFNYNMTREEANTNRSSIEAEARRTGGSLGQGANDSWIWLKTRGALLAADDLRDSTINVDVADGVITLKGTVATQQQKAKAAQVAQTIEGKKSVSNQLQVNPNASVLGTNGNTAGGNGNANRANTNARQ
ncbi:MAG: BON domain-containing protein [Acidobacteriota bacterium]|nr:BON domain-containing protein [Acidobacteriota bacterium]